MDEREAKLPVWAQQTINDLRKRLNDQNNPLTREIASLRPRVELLKNRNEALTELLECAAKGGHKTAKEIVEVLQTFELTLTPKE